MSDTSTSSQDLSQWITLDDFPLQYPNFNRAQLEWIHRNREVNGFDKAFRKIGKRRYIHAGKFAECLHYICE